MHAHAIDLYASAVVIEIYSGVNAIDVHDIPIKCNGGVEYVTGKCRGRASSNVNDLGGLTNRDDFLDFDRRLHVDDQIEHITERDRGDLDRLGIVYRDSIGSACRQPRCEKHATVIGGIGVIDSSP